MIDLIRVFLRVTQRSHSLDLSETWEVEPVSHSLITTI